jgi:TnpA family transposase
MFGLFWSLGYQFSPKLAELKDARFWRIDPAADFGPLNGLARHRINTNLITTNDELFVRLTHIGRPWRASSSSHPIL